MTVPSNGHKIVLNTGTVLIRCVPVKWGLWIGTVAVRGAIKHRVGLPYLFHKDAITKVIPCPALAVDESKIPRYKLCLGPNAPRPLEVTVSDG